MEVIDLSLPLGTKTTPYSTPGTGYTDPAFMATAWVGIGDKETADGTNLSEPSEYLVSLLQMGAHIGTHVDAPSHFHAYGMTLDGLLPGWLAGWAALLDLREETHPCWPIDAHMLPRIERFGRTLGADEVPLLVTAPGAFCTPEVIAAIAQWPSRLIAVAQECSLEASEDEKRGHYPNTRRLLEAGKYLAVQLCGADQVRSSDLIVVAPLTLRGLEASPCRALAIRGIRLPWFQVEEVEPHVWSLAEPGHAEYVRSYLVVGDERAALIDTGTGIGDIWTEVMRLTDRPVDVILTHTHWDHVGGIGGAHRFSVVRFWDDEPTHRQQSQLRQGYTTDFLRDELREKKFGRPTPLGVHRDTFFIPGIDYAKPLRASEVIDLGNRTLKVIHTPGHSPGSISLLDEANRLLFVGDTFYWGPLYSYPNEFDIDAYLGSANKLAGLAATVRRVLPGHNELSWKGTPPDESYQLMTGKDLKDLESALTQVRDWRAGITLQTLPAFASGKMSQNFVFDFGRFSLECQM